MKKEIKNSVVKVVIMSITGHKKHSLMQDIDTEETAEEENIKHSPSLMSSHRDREC